MKTLSVTVDIHPDNRAEFMQAIRSVTENLRKEKGFKRSGIFQDVDNPGRFSLLEEWETRDDLDNHLRSDIFKVLLGALKVLGEHAEVRYSRGGTLNGK